ncbi:DUF2911 domain-containing protein [Pseudoflavitalea sp. G-6-1-2]|uniref:DUF2911 domain-containing protein n=1 Tax=Pseudoflavitalea sp. G-6-1-2 TaxID=2728841 RepID=UPI00146CA956|nr:DUF2911 domain-containing protein [Pseudoflavitalea sp. G-6-1-2]NML21070.1 DUF2911 domain-containing protein [Pseudoflavitalea sp. G-6-1-2]
MKKLLFLSSMLLGVLGVFAQEKPASPPANVSETVGGTVVTINYSQPALKGRTIGNEVAPFDQVWRTGANEATTFEVSKDVKVNGKALAAGKYGFFTIPGKAEWVLIFNKTWKQWGAYEYKDADDVLRLKVKPVKAATASERMTFVIGKDGKVQLLWGDVAVPFEVK